jgi:hypothetical protein
MQGGTLINEGSSKHGTTSTSELCDLVAAGLIPMLDPEKQMFCDTYSRTNEGMRRLRLSPRYTMMTLLGLNRYERSGRRTPVSIARILNSMMDDTSWISNVGDLGLLFWTCAELVPARLPEIYNDLRTEGALARFVDGRHGYTMEVAWYLTGLASCYLAGYDDLPGLAEQVVVARKILEDNCGPSGVYGHLNRRRSWLGHVRGRIGSFADQVYPTIAFARLSQALRDEKARLMAIRTAEKMCQLQAPLGEWCWHYDSVRGKVVSRYPVYSVHQHAMGPMMLFAVSEATGFDFNKSIRKGLAWISGGNELRRDFVEPSLGLVWRCIYLDSMDAYADAALRLFQLRRGTADARQLKVRYECRPYELGWLLYAFAGRDFLQQNPR